MLMINQSKGGRMVGYDEACAVPVPAATRSYQPLPNKELIDLIIQEATRVLGLPILSSEWGLARNDQQLFGVVSFDTGNHESRLVLGTRNSYDRSLSGGFASGGQVTVCDNLMFTGDSTVVMRKHTRFIKRDIAPLLIECLRSSIQYYERLTEDIGVFKSKPCSQDRGYELIGKAQGHGVLKPQQATIAFREWKDPSHEELSDKNIWGLYNAFTEALKKGSGGRELATYPKAHQFMLAA